MLKCTFQCFISHVSTSETEIKLLQPLKELVLILFQNHFSDIKHVGDYSRAAISLRTEIILN